jgi:hypothetical protein
MLMAFRSDFLRHYHYIGSWTQQSVLQEKYISMDNEVFIDININQSLQGQSAQAQSVRFLPVTPNSRL